MSTKLSRLLGPKAFCEMLSLPAPIPEPVSRYLVTKRDGKVSAMYEIRTVDGVEYVETSEGPALLSEFRGQPKRLKPK